MSTPPTLDFDRLLAPISGESPAGADLRANDSRESSYWLVRGARNDSSQIERKHADQPDVDDFSLAKCQWDVVVEKALAALSTESKDYEVAAWLCEALLREKGFAGLRDGLRLAREMAEVSEKARKRRLKPDDMQGGCITITSLGGIGGTQFTPIVNAPEVAILGVSRARMQPVWDGKAFVPRLILPLSLSYDHRVIDGALGARFTSCLSGLLSDMRRMLL